MNKMSNTETIIIDRVKAYAFPVILAVLGWFLIRTVQSIDDLIERGNEIQESLHEIKEKQAEAKGLTQGDINRLNQGQINIELRLNRIEQQLSKW
jgi:F0F1-type ATP synthase membrane subunit b/b'